MRRGFIFTLDALLAVTLVTIILVGIVEVTSSTSVVYTVQIRGQNKQVAENLLETFRTVPLSNLVPPTQIEEWMNGTDPILDLTYVDPQMTPLQIVATYWALDSEEYRQKAEVIMKYLLDTLASGYKYQLIINNYTSPYLTFDNSYANASDVGSATIMVSGYVANQTPRGYMAKAYLTKIITSQEKLVGIQRVLAGGYYCSYPVPSSYNYYELTVSSIHVAYNTTSYDETIVQSGNFQLNGSYIGGSVNIVEDLAGWSVGYYDSYGFSLSYYDTTGYIELTDGLRVLELWIEYIGIVDSGDGYEVDRYRVTEVYYRDEYGNVAEVYLNDGVYVDIVWKYYYVWQRGGWVPVWYIDSSSAFTTVPLVGYGCSYRSENSLDVKSSIILPDDADVTEGVLNLATRQGENVQFKINGTVVTYTGVRALDVTDYFGGGITPIEAYFYNPEGDEIGFGSGSWISLKYKTSIPQVEDPGLIKLYNITSEGTGIYYLNSLFVPGNITGIDIRLTVSGVHEVRIYYSNGTGLNLVYENTSLTGDYTVLEIPNSTIMPNITTYTTLSNLSKKNFNLVIMLDAYYGGNSVKYAGQDYHVEWNNPRILYGYPDSYISISYASQVRTTRFTIPMEEIHQLDSTYDTEMHFNYYLPDKAVPWYVDIWTAILFYPDYVDTNNDIVLKEGPSQEEFLRFPLDLYLIRVAYTKIVDYIMVNGSTNYFQIESEDPYYLFRYLDSRAIVHYFLNGYAPYGDIFTYYAQDNACGYNLTYYYQLGDVESSGTVVIGNCLPSESPKPLTTYDLEPWKYALDDAIYRLFIQLGAKAYSIEEIKLDNTLLPGTLENPIRIELKELAGKAIGIKNVPATGGTIQVTLRIWRGE